MSRYVNVRLRKSVSMIMDADVSCLNDVKKRFWGEYYVYMHTFPDGRRYIGQTGKPVKERCGLRGNGYKGNKKMYDEIGRVGWDNVRHEIVATVYGRKNALLLERGLMEEWLPVRIFLYDVKKISIFAVGILWEDVAGAFILRFKPLSLARN